jgi:hypothetical protein
MHRDRDYTLTVEALRWLLVLINVLTALAGIGLLVLGIYAMNSRQTIISSSSMPVLTLILGCLVFFISFLGCFGAVTMNKRMVASFAWVLTVLVVIQLVMAVVSIAMQSRADSLLDDMWQNAYDHHPRIIRDIQDEFACCGYKHTEDRAIPKSSPEACRKSPYFGYEAPCYSALKHAYKSQQTMLITTALILVSVQILSLVCAFSLQRFLEACPPHGRDDERQGLLSQFGERTTAAGGASVGERA